ncbi:luciferase domain-containing protein [Hymenobacter terricola]|uniref:luciferase domain-containing protein n=1 Tax=Hymenobacter terricola TaxID=2819236 RepID=UPI001B31352A|nr:luciferase family protein [Hymenobacter terricola]
MKLSEKGPLLPPPVLAGPGQHTAETVQSWPGVVAATHWDLFNRTRVDGADFYVGDAELGHIHLNGDVHLPTAPALGLALLAQGLARPFPYGGEPGEWVTFPIRTAADAAHATWLFRLNYDCLHGIPLAELTQRLRDRDALSPTT